MPRPACIPCRRFMRPKENGAYLIEGMPVERDAKPGLEQPDAWVPYKVWSADLWRCPTCGAEVAAHWGAHAISERHKPDFAGWLAAAEIQINDC